MLANKLSFLVAQGSLYVILIHILIFGWFCTTVKSLP